MNIISLRGFWLKTISISYGDSPSVVVISELYADGNNITSVDHSVFFIISVYDTSEGFL